MQKQVTFTKENVYFGRYELPNDETLKQLENAGFTACMLHEEERIPEYYFNYPEIPQPTPKQAIIYIGFICFALGLALGLILKF
jgi:hypothetical protein